MAKAAKVTIVEADHIVEIGDIDPNDVDLPGIFVDRVVPATAEKKIEILKLRDPEADAAAKDGAPKNAAQERRNRIGKRASEELKQGYYVNLGVGTSTACISWQNAPKTDIRGRYPYPCGHLHPRGSDGLDPI